MAHMSTTTDEQLERIRKRDPEFAASIDRVRGLIASIRTRDEEADRLAEERERLDRLYGRRFILIRF